MFSKYNAWKQYEELSQLKETRKKKRKNSEIDGPPKKQPKLAECIPQKYGAQDPRKIDRTNAIASMICTDAAPTSIVSRRGFKNFVEKMDPKYSLPAAKTFSSSVIPKLKETVDQYLNCKIEHAIQNENSIGFTTDGLDCQDADNSSIYSFSIYFFDKNEFASEVVCDLLV